MFSLNGVPLDNPDFGWVLRAPSKPLSNVAKRVVLIPLPDRDGQSALPGYFDPVPVILMVQTPREHYEDLLALVTAAPLTLSRTDTPSRSVECTLLSTDYEGFGDADAILDVPIMLTLDGPHWRDTVEATVEETLTASTTLDCFAGLSAPVGDALIRVTGPTTAVQLSNPATGAIVSYPVAVASGKALVYDMADQSAELVDSGDWGDGADVSGDLDLQGPRLTLTPVLASPGSRKGQLKVDATGTTSVSKIAVKGKGAYLVG